MAKHMINRRDFLKGTAAAAGAALFGLSGLTGACAEEASAEAKDLYILYTNDVHCGIDDNIGYAGIADAKAALQALGKEVILTDSGDAIQGGLVGTLSKGKYIVDIMNRAGYDVVTLGNHEFDYGLDNLIELYKQMDYPVVCCNFRDTDGQPVFKPYTILEAAGRKIGFIGCVTPTTITSSTPRYFQNEAGEFIYDFCYDTEGAELAAAVQESIDAAKAEGADLIVVLGHIGVDPEGTGSSIYAKLQSDKLIGNTSGIDLFLDGHSHTVLPMQTVAGKDGKEAVLSQTGTKLAYIGLAIIGADGSITTRLLDDAGMRALIKEIQADMSEDLNTVIATTEYPLYIHDPEDDSVRLVRTQETNLGDFCADALRITCNADIGLINGGGVRVDVPAGEMTFGTFINVFPFGNEVCVRKVTGAELLDALEHSVSQYPSEFGGFLQVSGLSFTFDSSIESTVKLDENSMFECVEGDRRVKDVYIGDEPVDPEREYVVASLTYILRNGGNGYSMFNGDFVLETGAVDSQALCTYAQDNLGGVIGEEYEAPLGEGRIIIE